MHRGRRLVALGLLVGLIAAPGSVRAADELMDLTLEELAAFRITSVTRHAGALGRSPAAVHVITGEDMRRSGYTSIAEALRMVPGMHVAREGSSDWAIGARGFNTGLSNKLLVMIDGRSVYSPFFSGVFWEIRDVPVEDIDRIEVIRGPGASLWGANAVNGVINIITRHASEAAGWTLRGGGGTEERAFGLARYGGSLGPDADYRLTASGFARDDLHNRNGPDDEWRMSRVQGRADWTLGERDSVTLLGEAFHGSIDQQRSRTTLLNVQAPPPPDNERGDRTGASVQGVWEHELEGGSDLRSQLWYEYTDIYFPTLREQRHTVDLDVQHHSQPFDRHEFVWGGAYRYSYDEAGERGTTTLDPRTRGVHLVTGFLQDQITLVPDHLDLTLGSKFEYNEFTGFEVQPSGRLALTPTDWITLWGAVSRAVRTPTRLEDDANLGIAVLPPLPPSGSPPFQDATRPTLFVLAGNSRFDAETLIAYEGGYRMRPHEDVSIDIAGFYNDYDDLLTAEIDFTQIRTVPAMGGVPEHILFPLILDNELEGHSYGGEIAAWWQVKPWWRLHGSYSYIDVHLSPHTGGDSLDGEDAEHSVARNLAFLRSSFDLPHDVQFDALLRYVDRVQNLDIDAYIELDLRLAWAFREDWEVAVVGQNLLDEHHQEGSGPDRVQRGVYGQLLWRFGDDR